MVNSSIVLEWQRGADCLQAALICVDHGLYADAVSRACYSIMHSAKAALANLSIHSRSHKGLKNQFGLHLVRPGLIEVDYAIDLNQSYEQRLRADYDITENFTAEDGVEACNRAQAFRDRMRLYLGNSVPQADSSSSQ